VLGASASIVWTITCPTPRPFTSLVHGLCRMGAALGALLDGGGVTEVPQDRGQNPHKTDRDPVWRFTSDGQPPGVSAARRGLPTGPAECARPRWPQ
jgi:hypothetical protein